jgi:hypothetical protein
MVVWGGNSGGTLDTGGLYDPSTDSWATTSTTGAPTPRGGHTAVWTGSRMIIWGGSPTNTGGIYDLGTDTWTPTSTTGAPTARSVHTAVWTGSEMIIWGGSYPTNTGASYSNPAVLPPPPSPADFYTVAPCRLVDTRNAAAPSGGPALVAGAVRSFPVTGGVCGIPSSAGAVSVNVTVVGAAAQGNLTLYPGDAAGPPLASTLNFTAGVTRANNAVVRVAVNGGTINVKNGSAGSTHFVLDVNGYFRCLPPPCPVPIAVDLRVTSATGGPVPGLTVDLVGGGSGQVQCIVEETRNRCLVPGGRGTYQLRVAAPGYQTADLIVVVPGSDAPPCGCATVQTQEIEVVLTPG